MSEFQQMDDSHNDGVFMDGDEEDLLSRFQADNPTMQAFQDSDGRRRSVEECLVEAELEKLADQAKRLMTARRTQLTKDARVQLFPSHHTVPSVAELRQLRKAVISRFDVRGCSHAAFEGLGDVLAKEVALASEHRNGVSDSLVALTDFYTEYTMELASRQLTLARRWHLLGSDDRAQLTLRKQYADRQLHLSEEYSHCKEVLLRLETYGAALQSSHDAMGEESMETLGQSGRIPMPLDPTDAQIYVNHHIFQQRSRRRFERFLTKAKMVPHYKRYELFDRLVKYMLGGKVGDINHVSEYESDALPTMIVDDAKHLVQLEELSTGFKLTGYDRSDLHEFLYHLGKRYSSTHEFQSQAWRFLPLSLYAATRGSAEEAAGRATGEVGDPVYLRPSPWSTQMFTAFYPRTQPDWELEQLSTMQTVTSLSSRQVATTEAEHLRIDMQLEADFNFVAEESAQVTLDGWRRRAQHHRSRAMSSVPVSSFDRLVQKSTHTEDEGDADPQGDMDMTSLQRIQAVYQLRFLRTRQFRLQLLKTLNYFASVLKDVSRDCRNSGTVRSATGVGVVLPPLEYSEEEMLAANVASPMVMLDEASDKPNVDEFEARLMAALGLEGEMGVDAAQQSVEGDTSASRDPFWFTDTYEPIDYSNSLQRSNVRDGVLGVLVMEEWAIAEMQRVEQRMLYTASFYVNKHLDHSRTSSSDSHSPEHALDTAVVVEDIYECELWFQQSKVNMLDVLREAYLHSPNLKERSMIAKSMLEVICSVPRLDLSDRSFMLSYTNQVVVFDLSTSLAKEIVQHQIEVERRVLTQIHAAIKETPQTSLDLSHNAYLLRFGVASMPSSDTSLYRALFPKSSIINIFDIFSTLGVICSINGLVDGAVESLLGRFGALRSTGSTVFLQKEILQEFLVQWRLLGDEEAIARKMQHVGSRLGESDDEDEIEGAPRIALAGAIPVVGMDTSHQGGLYSPLHIREVVERIAVDRTRLEGVVDPVTASKFLERPSHHVPMLVPHNGDDEARPKPAGTDATRRIAIPPPCVRMRVWFDVMEVLRLQAALMSSLYETEVWCGVHRMQAKLMGVNVKRTELEPIDFEGKRVFMENDEMEAAIHSAIESDGDFGTSVFSLASQLALDGIMAHHADFLNNLSICEFEKSMGDFDLRTLSGIDRLLRNRTGDFRRAFYVQVTNKNVFTAISMCNMVSLDAYLEGLYRVHAEGLLACRGHGVVPNSSGMLKHDFANAFHSPRPGIRIRLTAWPLLVKGESHQQYFIDRRHLQRLFVSVNQVKSVHRKCTLQEMSHQATVLLGGPGHGESIRRELKSLKESLVDRYCNEIALATLQYADKYHICALANHLRAIFSEPYLAESQSFFIFGGKGDVVRNAPRGPNAQSEGRKPATCMLAKNGGIDEIRYIPHFAQVIGLSFESEIPIGAGLVNVRPEHFHLHGYSHLKQNALLDVMGSVLHDWLGLVQLTQTVASTQLPAPSLLTTVGKCTDTWKSELFRINSDIEALPDPTDFTSVRGYLSHRHIAMSLCVSNTLRTMSYQSRKLSHGASSMLFSQTLQKFSSDCRGQLKYYSSVHASRNYFPRSHCFGRIRSNYGVVSRSSSGTPWLYEHLRRIGSVTFSQGSTIDAMIQECEGTIDTAPFDAMRWYGSLDQDTRGLGHSYLQFAHPRLLGREIPLLYPSAAVQYFMAGATHEERLSFFSEFGKLSEMIEDCTEDVQEQLAKDLESDTTFMTSTLAPLRGVSSFGPAHYDVAYYTARRDGLRELYMLLLRQVSTCIPADLASRGGISSSLPSVLMMNVPLDDIYQRTIVHRARIMFEKESVDPVAGKNRRKGRCVERELRLRQCRLLIMEIHKLLMARTCAETMVVIASLESEALMMSKVSISTNKKHSAKAALFSEFCALLVAKAHCTRGDNDKMVTYHIPDHSLNLAIDTLSTRLLAWESNRCASIINTAETLTRSFAALAVNARAQQKEARRALELADKALPRRIQAGVAASKFEVLRLNATLSKENELLRVQLAQSRERARDEIRLEFEERLGDLQSRLRTRESQFASYKQKLFRDMQESLEDVRRSAMFSISSMEHAPVHVKRQALKIAISDDELNTVREQNAELRQALLKVKLWYEIKIARLATSHEQKMREMKSRADDSQHTYWSDKGVSESELVELRRELSSLQVSLTKSELEVEVLRRDLQSQLNNKKDLVQWKLQSGKQIEELNRKLKRFEKLNSAYDLEKIVAEHERRLAAPEATTADISAQQSASRVLRGQSLRAATSRVGTLGVPNTGGSGVLVPLDEYRRLQDQCERERKMKEQAFLKIDTLRQGQVDSNESLIWQRRYFEAASELQRRVQEIDALKAHIDSSHLPPPRRF